MRSGTCQTKPPELPLTDLHSAWPDLSGPSCLQGRQLSCQQAIQSTQIQSTGGHRSTHGTQCFMKAQSGVTCSSYFKALQLHGSLLFSRVCAVARINPRGPSDNATHAMSGPSVRPDAVVISHEPSHGWQPSFAPTYCWDDEGACPHMAFEQHITVPATRKQFSQEH